MLRSPRAMVADLLNSLGKSPNFLIAFIEEDEFRNGHALSRSNLAEHETVGTQ
ncbi:MAG TPA: hypothetical protein VHV29_03195 [Terriglobales bacterium]|jgi:hypothetical protein|nr:hypothetical protein [Terriglobales bacterium]